MSAPADWERLRALFDAAVALPPEHRAAFLTDSVNGDPAIRREVESLIAAHEAAGGFLREPTRHGFMATLSATIEPPVLSAGARLGAFEIEERIGAGGMGEVYRAHDTRLDRFVAVKVLSSELGVVPRGRERFEREARAISRLSHPRICTVHDVGVADLDGRDIHYIVMELLDGETLATRLARGPLSMNDALSYGIDIADALVAAHAQAVVHRDLKPGNVMITSTGVKLLDFGLAQLRTAGGSQQAAEIAALTSTGLVFGTVPYMSPEQLRGEPVDVRTDVFAFGALLHEMLTGHRPFEAESQAALIAAILEHEAVPVSERQPLASPGLDRIVRKCLAKNPDERWQTARDLTSELAWVRDGREDVRRARTPVSAPKRRRAWQLMAVGIPTIAAFALTIALWRTLSAPVSLRHATHLSLNFPPGITLNIPINGTSIAIAPDGSRIAFIGENRQGERQLFIHSLDTGRTVPVPDTREVVDPMFSADSQWVAFGRSDIKKVPAGGGPVQEVGTAKGGGPMTWLSDGRFVRGNLSGQVPLQQVIPDGDPLTHLLPGEEGHVTPLLIDGGPLLFTSVRGGMLSGLNSISAVRLHTAQRLRWPAWLFRWWIEKEPNPSEATEVIRSATSPQLVGRDVLAFARGRSLYAAGFDSRATRLTGEPRAMGIDVQTTLYQAGPMYAVARNGTLVYAQPPGGRRLVWVDRSDKEEFVNAPEQMYSHFRLSPDGTRVAAYLLDGDRDLSVIGLDGSLGVKLTTGAARDVMPVWSPDGKTIYFTTAERNINRVPADGSTAAQTIYQQPAPGRLHATSITPDGKRLLMHWDISPRLELRQLALGPTPEPTTVFAESGTQSDGQLSHDGRWIAYASGPFGSGRQIWARPFPEAQVRRWTVSPGVGYQPIWSHDDRKIFYRTEDGTVMSVPVSRGPTPLDFKVGKPVRVVKPVNTIRDWSSGPTYDVSPDGRRFLFIKAPEFDIRSLNVVLNWDVEVKAALAGKGR
jgi:serine/threonine protein kinase